MDATASTTPVYIDNALCEYPALSDRIDADENIAHNSDFELAIFKIQKSQKGFQNIAEKERLSGMLFDRKDA